MGRNLGGIFKVKLNSEQKFTLLLFLSRKSIIPNKINHGSQFSTKWEHFSEWKSTLLQLKKHNFEQRSTFLSFILPHTYKSTIWLKVETPHFSAKREIPSPPLNLCFWINGITSNHLGTELPTQELNCLFIFFLNSGNLSLWY